MKSGMERSYLMFNLMYKKLNNYDIYVKVVKVPKSWQSVRSRFDSMCNKTFFMLTIYWCFEHTSFEKNQQTQINNVLCEHTKLRSWAEFRLR